MSYSRSNSGTGGNCSLESTASEDDSPESSSSPLSAMSNEFRSVLDEFRADWQKELKENTLVIDEHGEKISSPLSGNEVDNETLAKNLYRTAVDLEQKGKVYDALPYYRKAVQIEPNIEFKYYEYQKLRVQKDEDKLLCIKNAESSENEEQEKIIDDLYKKFQLDVLSNLYEGKFIQNSHDASSVNTDHCHISDLPPELVLYILRWVISNQLDMRSLEQCATVCKGLYLCARDEELWRLACIKVWGVDAGTLIKHDGESRIKNNTNECLRATPYFSTWRQMFIERERVLFNGCYISKTTYIRMGENSFQDQYYRPVQLVEYYRYLRFLTDGTVLMMTTADEPVQAVCRLKNIHQLRPDILKGKYHLNGNILSIVLKKQQSVSSTKLIANVSTVTFGTRYRRSSNAHDIVTNNTKYFLKFQILNTTKRKFSQLKWIHYSIVQSRNKNETTNEFELTPSKYPAMWFSIVRSYHSDADSPLA